MMLRIAFRALLVCASLASFAAAEPIRFRSQVQPLLSDRCISCHGQDPKSRSAGLRLDTREGALAQRKNGAAIVPGNPEASLILARVQPANPRQLMPPAYSHKQPLSPTEVAILRQWIAEGAPWEKHWSLEPPVKPSVQGTSHPIDQLVTRQLTKLGLQPAPPAKPHTLARRLSFDLTGLPPQPEHLASLLRDPSDSAFARYTDQLLASPAFGERMAMWWLDVARYSDTDGFQADDNRTNWPWRDWVVSAFNTNMPFSRFTREQLAGDLLPNATAQQRLATSFHRNHMTNGEGGRDPEESRIDYVLDRTNTTGTIWLGLTLGCAQCHTHKFDPISHHEYYSMTAFFNSIDEDGRAGKKAKPYLQVASEFAAPALAEAQTLLDQRKREEAQARLAADPPFTKWLAAQKAALPAGFQAWRPMRAATLESAEGTQLTQDPTDSKIVATGPNPRQDDYRVIGPVQLPRVTGIRLEVFPPLSRGASGQFLLTDIKVQVRRKGSAQIRDILVSGAIADYSADKDKNNNYGAIRDTLDDDPRNGWTTIGAPANVPHTAIFALAEPLTLAPDEDLIFELRHRSTVGDANLANFRLSLTDQPGPAVQSLEPAPLELLSRGAVVDEALRARLKEQFLATHTEYALAKNALARAQRQYDEIKDAAKVDVMVLAERAQPRESHVLLRGVWDKKGDVVQPDVPTAVAPWPQGAPRNRIGLADWLLAKENPLTARVVVNHLWQLVFGAGLVRTTEDFGMQGERPEHPELLDWLAVDFVEHGWDVKYLLRQIVTSQTYRQSSLLSAAMAEKDPENRLLARGPRFRLPSWMLRDAALHHAGLLQSRLGGPPVKPYQPAGVWEELFMGRFNYEPSQGPAQYRRTLYAFWRRSIAPTFLFDSAQRRSCEVRVARTNTPLQALTLLNDETYLEASRQLAQNSADLSTLFFRVLGRSPDRAELAILQRERTRALRHYRAHPADAAKLLAQGQQLTTSKQSASGKQAELAATMVVASMVLNLDEAITHE